jgi:hypothetical protein
MALLTLIRSERALIAAALIVAAPMASAQPTTVRSPEQSLESEVKAVFLYNFAKYVDWPSAPQGGSATIRMCVPNDPGFLEVLREAVRDEVINGRRLTAVGLDGLDAARECDILYVGSAATADAGAWINAVRGRQVLTVGDGSMVNGLVIAFVRDQNRIRFDISRQAASKQQLAISSRLLGLARRVAPE